MAETDDEQSPLLTDDDSEPSPTIGQRMAGMGRPAPALAPVDTAEPAPPVRIPLDPSKLPDILRPRQITPSEVPQPQTGSSNPNLANLAKQQATLGAPLDRTDPKYKPGVGTRILRGVSDFMSGGAPGVLRGAIDPTSRGYYGKGAVNNQFTLDDANRRANLSNVDTQIGTQEKLDSENEKMYRDAIRQAYEGQVGSAREATAAAQNENATTRSTLAKAQADLAESRSNALDSKQPPEPKTEAEIALALQTAKAKGDKAGIAKYAGALEELRKQKSAGKDTSAGDVAKAIQVSEFRAKQHDTIDKAAEEERQKRYTELDKDVGIKYNAVKLAAAKQQIDADLTTKYQPKHQKADQDADGMLSLTKSGAKLQSGNQPVKSSAGASKIDPKNLPKTVIVGGKTRTVAGYNQQTKKVILAPE